MIATALAFPRVWRPKPRTTKASTCTYGALESGRLGLEARREGALRLKRYNARHNQSGTAKGGQVGGCTGQRL
jgi:hypothetical protein